MKAAILKRGKDSPICTDIIEPTITNENEMLVSVKAVAIKNLDKSIAYGKHYSSKNNGSDEKIIGGDGVCILEDGSRVYAIGKTGMAAEKAIIYKDKIVHIPNALDSITAAALPNAVIGSAMALKFKANIQKGDVVLINGATGFTGRIAIQIAKIYGASRIIVTGRNMNSLADLLQYGADETISILQEDQVFKQNLKNITANHPVHIILDYLWGHSAEMILETLEGNGNYTQPIRYVSIGNMSGETINLSAATLRSCNIQLNGSGLGSWSKEEIDQLFKDILPQILEYAATKNIIIQTEEIPLEHIDKIWSKETSNGKRIVIII